MAYGVKTANIYDLLDNNDDENVPIEEVSAKQAPAKVKEVEKPSKELLWWSSIPASSIRRSHRLFYLYVVI